MAEADWGEAFHSEYRFMRVSRATGAESGRLRAFRSGGTIERNEDSSTRESGTATVVGPLDVGADLVRVYLDATGLRTGWRASVALGTFLPSVTSRDVDGPLSTSSVTLSGRLSELADDQFESPLVVPAGADPVEAAASIARACGLGVSAEPCSRRLSSDWSFGMGDAQGQGETKLDAVNALLEIAGFSSASTDAMGTVLMRRYAEPADRPATWRFAEGRGARFLRSMTDERDSTGVANVVVCSFETADDTTTGVAVDSDLGSPYSTVSLGRRVVARYGYQDSATQEEADAKAAELLRTSQSVIRRVTFEHAFCPVSVSDVVELEYPTGGVSGRFAVRTQSIELGAGCKVRCEARSFER